MSMSKIYTFLHQTKLSFYSMVAKYILYVDTHHTKNAMGVNTDRFLLGYFKVTKIKATAFYISQVTVND